MDAGYYWVRIFDYVFERDRHDKGILLDEFYLKDVASREEAKEQVKERYLGDTVAKLRFARPKADNDGVYAIVMDSNKFFFDRFYVQIDSHCFWCHTSIKGKASEFPRASIGDKPYEDDLTDTSKTAYFCGYECRGKFNNSQRKDGEGEFQTKEEGLNGEVFGYIYLIYNRQEDTYYIGQTRYLPFFRWQEHVKDGGKGDLSDLSFSTLTAVRRHPTQSEEENKKLLNSMEAWWIDKYEHEGHKVFNVTRPRITIDELKDRFNDMVEKEGKQLALF